MTISSFPFSKRADFEEPRGQAAKDAPARSAAARSISDAVIEEAIWEAILKDRSLGPKHQENIQVDVEDGRVKLRGHVAKQWQISWIINIANRTDGAVWIKSELVADELLQREVINALLQDERTAPYIFTVKSAFGWIHLRGLVPGQEIAKAAEGVAGFVPTVRGILSLPSVFVVNWLPSDDPEPVRRAFQPRIGSGVCQMDADEKPFEVGQVAQVIIDPCSRLVTHMAVRVSGGVDQEGIEKLVPMAAVEAVSANHVWLKEGEVIEKYLPYERKTFSLPPPSWRPPFPYLPGNVRWSLVSA